MSSHAGPNINRTGLLYQLDAANPKNSGLSNVEVLVVAGGGGGGYRHGAGGGAGGLIYKRGHSITPGNPYTITIGNGGAGGTGSHYNGYNGENSSAFGLTAVGGGYGGGYDGPGTAGGNGGSGGGSGQLNGIGGTGTSEQGHVGGNGSSSDYKWGGGGGAGAPGVNGFSDPGTSTYKAGNGGQGLSYFISGSLVWYAGGGGGGSHGPDNGAPSRGLGGLGGGGNGGTPGIDSPGVNGTANTGGGGGGAATSAGGTGVGGDGGSGVVIVRYNGPCRATGGTITTVGSDTIHTFTSSGTFTPSALTNGVSVGSYADLSGNNRVTVANNGPVYNSDGSITFDGDNDELVTSSFTYTAYCINLWLYNNNVINAGTAGGPSTYQTPISIGAYPNGVHLGDWDPGLTDETVHIWSTGYKATGIRDVVPIGLHNFIFNWNGSSYDIWIDGEKKITYAHTTKGHAALISGTNTITIGNDSSSYNFYGKIYKTEIYGSSKTDADILSLYKSQSKKFIGTSSLCPAASASAIKTVFPNASSGIYWLQSPSCGLPFQAYIDFTSPNGPWTHVGTAVGNTRGLYTYHATWAYRETNSGTYLNPFATDTSNFNANSFIHCRGSKIMIRYGTGAKAYVQASGFVNESWRDVYKFLNTLTAWPTQPSYNRALTITARGSDIAAYNTTGYGILYGTHPTIVGDYSNWLVYSFDGGGDTWAYLTTGVVSGNAANGESDIGIGESELGPANGSIFPGDNFATDTNSNDAGSNGSAAGSGVTFANIPFSLWINN